jgi:hypothetical protein
MGTAFGGLRAPGTELGGGKYWLEACPPALLFNGGSVINKQLICYQEKE